jgi:hypothetical protein
MGNKDNIPTVTKPESLKVGPSKIKPKHEICSFPGYFQSPNIPLAKFPLTSWLCKPIYSFIVTKGMHERKVY